MSGVQDQAQLTAPGLESAQQGYGVCAAGEAHGQAKSRPEQRFVEGKRGTHL
jgi:hypothetical protein